MKSNNYWEFIPQFDNKYIISKDARVISLDYNKTKSVKELKQFADKNGYLKVKLSKQGKVKSYFVHHLMAETFLANPNNYKEINHKSGIKTENSINNLEWCNRSYNVQHAYNNGLKFAKKGKDHPKSMPVKMYDLDMNLIKEFISYTDCCKYLKIKYGYNNVQPSHISRVALGKRKRYKNFTFRKVVM